MQPADAAFLVAAGLGLRVEPQVLIDPHGAGMAAILGLGLAGLGLAGLGYARRRR